LGVLKSWAVHMRARARRGKCVSSVLEGVRGAMEGKTAWGNLLRMSRK